MHLKAVMLRLREVMRSKEREVRLSPSMMAREIHNTHPVAPLFQSPMGPGAHPLCLAKGPSIPYPASKRQLNLMRVPAPEDIQVPTIIHRMLVIRNFQDRALAKRCA